MIIHYALPSWSLGTRENALHPYGKKKNPDDPVDRKAFDKDRDQYWKDRLKQMEEEN